MHDPSTVAFDIKYPWRRRPDKFWPKGYRSTFITIWHVDPEDSKGKCGCRSDDTCGWFSPPYTVAERDRIKKLGEQQYSTIFNKQWAVAEGKDYARFCYEPTSYDAIYWAWRAIKQSERPRGVWQYGKDLTHAELAHIYSLDANPVDNLRLTVAGVHDAESCSDFFLLVYRSFRRFNRPWYRHPRWHVWHWRIQIHPLQKIRRRLFDRCDACGKPFGWSESPTGTWSGDRLWHSACVPHLSPAPSFSPAPDKGGAP